MGEMEKGKNIGKLIMCLLGYLQFLREKRKTYIREETRKAKDKKVL